MASFSSETSGSAMSDSSNPLTLEALQEMDDHAIKQLVDQTRETNHQLKREVDMFEKYQKRLDSKDTAAPASSLASVDTRPTQRKKARKVGVGFERLSKLTVEQKSDIATRELDEIKVEMEQRREEREKVFDNHKAKSVEADHKLGEINKATYEFERDIIRGGVNVRTGKLLGERVVKYFEDYLKSRDNLMDKLRLKNSAMRVKEQKLQMQLKQKEEAGDVRHEVDYEQLKIENQQLSEHMENKNRELLRLKVSAGRTMQVLNSYKKKVQGLNTESHRLDQEIRQRNVLQEKILSETILVSKEKEKAEELSKTARHKLEDFHVPEVMEYVHKRSSQYDLIKMLRIWERKVEIAEMTLRTHRQAWHQMSKQLQQQPKQRQPVQVGNAAVLS